MMVASLVIPKYDDIQLTRSIISERQRGRNAQYFNNIQTYWESRIKQYLELQGNPTQVLASSITIDSEKNKFINLYTKPDKDSVQYLVIKNLRLSKLIYCPACGEDGSPGTLDHYLPKTTHPEFALLTKNLTPMCQLCQTEKLSEVLDKFGNKQFLHPYYDLLPNLVRTRHGVCG